MHETKAPGSRLGVRGQRVAFVSALLLASFTRASSAAEQGFALNRFEPAERDSAWFAMASV